MAAVGRETKLAKALAPVSAQYDYILIDCQPSLSLLTVNALADAATCLLLWQIGRRLGAEWAGLAAGLVLYWVSVYLLIFSRVPLC